MDVQGLSEEIAKYAERHWGGFDDIESGLEVARILHELDFRYIKLNVRFWSCFWNSYKVISSCMLDYDNNP